MPSASTRFVERQRKLRALRHAFDPRDAGTIGIDDQDAHVGGDPPDQRAQLVELEVRAAQVQRLSVGVAGVEDEERARWRQASPVPAAQRLREHGPAHGVGVFVDEQPHRSRPHAACSRSTLDKLACIALGKQQLDVSSIAPVCCRSRSPRWHQAAHGPDRLRRHQAQEQPALVGELADARLPLLFMTNGDC